MTTALLLCALLLVIVYCTYVNYKAEEEWRIVKEFPEWELINKSKDRIFRDIHVDVQTYSRFQNVRSDNILKYCNVSTLSDLSKARVDFYRDTEEAIILLHDTVECANYRLCKQKLTELVNTYMTYKKGIPVHVYYRTPKRGNLRVKVFYVPDSSFTVQKIKVHSTVQEERAKMTKKLRFQVLQRDNFTCQYCGAHGEGVVLEVDHIVPVSKGGRTELSNLITACFDCNRGKGSDLVTNKQVM